jgi:hypothetical protein
MQREERERERRGRGGENIQIFLDIKNFISKK